MDGGDRPQRGFIVGETAPNAVLSWGRPPPTRFYRGGDRPQRGFIWRVIEKAVTGY
jgi:hypothetical protein